MSGVDYMSTAGLRVLISYQKKFRRYNRGEIVICSVPPHIYRAFDLGGFSPLFKFFNDIALAVGHF